jgi:DNA-binding beta-propeller fold protein YncE
MSFQRAARAALAGQSGLPRILVAVVVVSLAGLSLSCGNSSSSGTTRGLSHNAYVTLPATGSVLLLHINGATGAITLGAKTPPPNTSPTGLALLPSKKFLYVANSRANTISISTSPATAL